MIGVIGYMSGGKSYFAVEHMLSRMREGHLVASNIVLNCQAVSDYLAIPCIWWKQLYYWLCDNPKGYHHLSVDDYESYPHGSPRGSKTYNQDICYIYLDEASSIFDSMTHSSDASIKKVATWCRHTEKRGQILFLIMQFASELHKRLRVHITEFIQCTNTAKVNIPLIGLKLPPFLRNMTIRCRLMPDGETQIAPAKWYRLDHRIYDCYNTAQIVVGDKTEIHYKPIPVNRDALRLRQLLQLVALLFMLYLFVQVVFVWWWARHA